MNTTNANLLRNKEVVRDFLEVFSSGNMKGAIEFLDNDCTWWISGNIPGISGTYSKQEMSELLSGIVDLYKQAALPITPVGMTAEGDNVAVEAVSLSELKNGKVLQNTYHFLFVVNGDRITKIKEYSDTLHLFEIFVAE